MKLLYRILGRSGQHGFIISLFILLFFSFYPTIYESFQANSIQKGRELVLEHGYTPDYNLYLSKIWQGSHGRWTVLELYTYEDHQGSLLQIFYVALGKLGRLGKLGGVVVSETVLYHLARLVFGALLLIAIYRIALSLFPNSLWALSAFWLSIATSSWPVIQWAEIQGGKWFVGSFMAWWTIIDPLRRITITPHLLAGQAMLLWIVYLFFYRRDKGGKGEKWVKGGVLGIVGLILGIIFPPALLIAYSVVLGVALLRGISSFQFRFSSFIGNCILFTLFSFPALLYLSYMTSFYPWKALNDYNVNYPTYFPIQEFALACGPALVLAVVGGIIIVCRGRVSLPFFGRGDRAPTGDDRFLPMAVWIIGIFLLMITIRRIPTQNALRFTQVVHFVPMGMLAAYGLREIWGLKGDKGHWGRLGAMVIFFSIIGLGIWQMASSLYFQLDFIRQRVIAVVPVVPKFPQIMYPIHEFMDTLRFIEAKTPQNAVLLADETFGNYIPAYTGRRVYCCHANTPQVEERLLNVWGFFWGLPVDYAKKLLSDWRISYVVFGPQEKEQAGKAHITDLSKTYPFLELTYRNDKVSLYRVQ